MASNLVVYDLKKITTLIAPRKGEQKLGEHIELLHVNDTLETQLSSSDAKYVLLGIPEDIGVSANLGKTGTRNAWNTALPFILNIQHNSHTKGNKILLLGHLDFSGELEYIDSLSGEEKIEEARKITESIDKEVADLIYKITASGKKAIVVGGGHNNAYGLLKGTSLATGSAVNCLNVDAHTDFRKREGRHSGNGFSYAFHEGFLNNYYIFGIHENYTSKKIFKAIEKKKKIKYSTFEDLFIRRDKGFDFELNEAIDFIKTEKYGLEIDMDSIEGMPSSARTSSGLSLNMVREIVFKGKKSKNNAYIHICEAAPNTKNNTEITQVGKAIAYLVSDYIRK
ncbi:formimidoylglutamase [Galbibacter pacificus]|uniref:Formimidoylglutamase n=1 Tax=Galbibacter pacificus TaxID=2996052 RepID=A0ABT6FPZ3_9FLAO|nr:formimidoylglutamase [Galbibacter pacificus]MDG3582338.1 formimidoylglutamase [Galbibacter pacificus]MDG3585186.1 formimidoylglutamase [Galbibacter pacificus]